MNPLFLNTLIFKKQLDARKRRQSDLFQTVQTLGAAGIEVRREYFFENGLSVDIACCGEQAKQTGLRVFYSIPEKLFVNGRISNRLEDYFREGVALHAENLKLNIGEPMNIDAEICKKLENLTRAYSIQLTIENDQTAENGRLQFVSAVLGKLSDSPVGYTMDLGNWLWQGSDPLDAARQVGNYTTIFHLKDVSSTKSGLRTELLGRGTIDWIRALSECQQHVPVVIEYPIESLDDLKKEVAKVNEVLTKQKEGAQP